MNQGLTQAILTTQERNSCSACANLTVSVSIEPSQLTKAVSSSIQFLIVLYQNLTKTLEFECMRHGLVELFSHPPQLYSKEAKNWACVRMEGMTFSI